MAGRGAGGVITRYAGIQVQTSALGVPIAVGWGTFRCHCNLVDYLDFKSQAQKSGKGAGKGGSQTVGYTYSATLIMAICEGTIDAIPTVYIDSNSYVDGATTALAQAGLSMATGAIGQAVWSYLTSNHPDHAIGYSGLALVYASNYALGGSAQSPNHSFEIKRTSGFGVGSTPDADPSLVLTDFFQNARYGVPGWKAGLLGSMTQFQNYTLAANLLISPVIDAQRSAADFVTEILRATNSTCVWSEGVLKFIPYGDTAMTGNGKTFTPNVTVVYALTDGDFLQQGSSPVVQVDILDQSDAYNVVQLEYLDRTNQYNMAIALASDQANIEQFGMRRKDPDTVHCICAPACAQASAQLFLQRTLYIRKQYKFSLGWQFALLEPGDIVSLTDTGLGLAGYPVRIIQIDQDEKAKLSITAEDCPIGVGHAAQYTMQSSAGFAVNQNADPGGVEANLLLFSGDISNAAWSLVAATVAANTHTDQYGLSTADSLIPSVANSAHEVYQAVATFANVTYTGSVCIQKDVHKNARVWFGDGGLANGVYIEVDTNAGTILTAATVVGSATLIHAEMVPTLVAGIWQINLAVQRPATGMMLLVAALSDAGALVWTGDGTHALSLSQLAIRQGVLPGVYCQTQGAAAGPVIFAPPSVLNQAGNALWAAAAGGPNWGGCNVWVSADGTTYQQVGVIDAPGRFGSATTSLAIGTDPDTTHSLGVDLGACGGSLSSAAAASADNGSTLFLIDDELICYETATLTNPSRYTLTTYLRRGYLSTPIEAHSSGAQFIRLDGAVFDFPYFPASIGQTIYVKFQSFNLWGLGLVDLANCIAYPAIPYPVGSRPPASTAWSATATTISNAGYVAPIIVITGASDNPSAQGVVFYYRVTGTTTWSHGGLEAPTITRKELSTVTPATSYDLGVAYQVNGVMGQIYTIGSVTTAGAFQSGATVTDGAVLLSQYFTGTGTFTIPANSLAHADVYIGGAAGGDHYTHVYGEPNTTDFDGGIGGLAYKQIAVTPGTTTLTFSIGVRGTDGGYQHGGGSGTSGGDSTVSCAAPVLSMTGHGGTGATGATNGTNGTASGGSSNTTGGASATSAGYILIVART